MWPVMCAMMFLSLSSGNSVQEDTPFIQEYRESFSLGARREDDDVRAIAIAGNGEVLAATKTGVFCLRKGEKAFDFVTCTAHDGPAFDLTVDGKGEVWAGTWDGAYRWNGEELEETKDIDSAIAAVTVAGDRVIAVGREGIYTVGADSLRSLRCATSVRAVLPDGLDGLWIATSIGLYHDSPVRAKLYREEDGLVTSQLTSLAAMKDGTLWVGGLGGITIMRDGVPVERITDKNGLPDIEVTCIAPAADGTVWIGSRGGVARLNGKTWSLRHSKRWLTSDNVRDIAFDSEGSAWIATDAGVSVIRRRTMTLAEKAAHFERVSNERHMREPGLVELCALEKVGDTDSWKPCDDDNDGQYTAMYLATESFRYAATKEPSAQEAARKSFEALAFLQRVTGTSGFIARTVVPADWESKQDPNEDASEQEWADRQVADPRHKKVNIRWRPSADGKWQWKGDTSSDEITGHFYAYPIYYDLASDESDKEHVRDHVRRVMDYIVDNGYVLLDTDGEHTRWGVWAPEKLNDDPNWQPDRGNNSVEILSYLKTAWHITGDDKYQREYLRLLHDCHYDENVRRAKNFAPVSRTHIDDELLALAYGSLLRYENDPELLALYRESINHWYTGIKEEKSPFFNFMYASLTSGDPQVEDSVAFLRDMPLDLVNWTVDNSKREDVRLVREPEVEFRQTDRLLPPSERGVMRWDRNPWRAVQGDGGKTECAPTVWLLPYWMGRYYGYIR